MEEDCEAIVSGFFLVHSEQLKNFETSILGRSASIRALICAISLISEKLGTPDAPCGMDQYSKELGYELAIGAVWDFDYSFQFIQLVENEEGARVRIGTFTR